MEESTTAERPWKCWGTASRHAAEPFLWSLDFGLLGSRETLLHGSSKIFVEHARHVSKIWFPADLGPISRKSHNFSESESCFVFVVFAFKIKVSIILKIIQWTYQLRRKNDWCVG